MYVHIIELDMSLVETLAKTFSSILRGRCQMVYQEKELIQLTWALLYYTKCFDALNIEQHSKCWKQLDCDASDSY